MKEFEEYEVGDIVRVGDSEASQLYIITMKTPVEDHSFYHAVASNGSITMIWGGSIRKKVCHFDLEGLFEQMENDLLYGCKEKR